MHTLMQFPMPDVQSLKTIAEALNPLGPRACFYLAAAVSDFYLPWTDMVR